MLKEGGTITLKFLGKGNGLNIAALCLLWSWGGVELRLARAVAEPCTIGVPWLLLW